MTHSVIKIAVLGAGRWGVHLIRHFLKHPQSQLLAAIDLDPERLEAVRQQFNLGAEVVLARDWLALQELPDLEAVAIATPASTHYTLIAAALQQGYHVLAEKPLTLNLSEAIELCELAEKHQRHLFVDHTYLFHPAVERGKTVIQQGKLGQLQYGYAQRTHLEPVRLDVDVLWDLAIHDISIFNTWLGEIPIKVQASGTSLIKKNLANQNLDLEKVSNDESPFYDLVWLTLIYPSGFQAFIHLCWLNPDKQRRLGVVGTEGTLIFDELSTETPLILQHTDRSKAVTSGQEVLEIEPIEPLWKVCDRFLNCLQQNIPCPLSSGWTGLELVRILSALSQSLKLGGQIIQL